MGTQAQGQQGQQQNTAFYDASTGQYYPKQNSTLQMDTLGATLSNYLAGLNNQFMGNKSKDKYKYVDIAALYPEMYQGAQGMQGNLQMNGGLLGGQGAAQSASSGAGRFM